MMTAPVPRAVGRIKREGTGEIPSTEQALDRCCLLLPLGRGNSCHLQTVGFILHCIVADINRAPEIKIDGSNTG